MEYVGRVVWTAAPERVVVGALNDGNGIDLNVTQPLDGLSDAFSALWQFPLAMKSLTLECQPSRGGLGDSHVMDSSML